MKEFLGFTRKEITKEEYSSKWGLHLLAISTFSDPTGTLSPMSTPGTSRMITVWGTDGDTPFLAANSVAGVTKYFSYAKDCTCKKGCK